jgi:hypothetical protein
MNKKKLTNEELDAIGRELVRASAVPESEIERIVTAPMLFSSIKRRIEADRPSQKAETWREKWSALPVWNWHRATVAFATAAIFLAGTVAVLVFARRNSSPDLGMKLPEAPAAVTPHKPNTPPDIPQALPGDSQQSRPELADYRKEPVRRPRVQPRRAVTKQIETPTFEAEGAFYPVSYAGSSEEMVQGGQIVRTEIPRSSLFAMGMDVPLESANEKIKTDLLVGPDGVVRGVRIVK